MGLYDRFILPKIIELGCGAEPMGKQREKVVPLASGRVLEIGIGPGHNLKYYDPTKVETVIGLEPSAEMQTYSRRRAEGLPFEVEFIELPGEEIPLEDNSVDTVLVTYTLCTIPGVETALQGMRRVLKPSGRLIFCEHGRAPDANIRKWQDRINPLWGRFTGGCNINRAIPMLIEEAGFSLDSLDSMYLPSTPRLAGFNYWGVASPR